MTVFLQHARRLLSEGTGWAGLSGDALGFVLGDLAATGRWLVVCDEPDAAERVLRGIRFFHPRPTHVVRFPADDVRPYDGFSADPSIIRQRLRTLHRVASGKDVVVVAPSTALLQRVPDSAARERGTRLLNTGDSLDRDELTAWLTAGGYLAAAAANAPGLFAVRGDIVDVWPTGGRRPVRIDFWDDEIEELRRFDPETQRTVERMSRTTILPAREERLDEPALQRLRVELGRLATAQARGRRLRRRVIEELSSGIRFSGLEAWLPALVSTEAPLQQLAGLTTIVVHPDEVGASLREAERRIHSRYGDLDDDERPLVPPDERYVPAASVLDVLAQAHAVHEFATPGVSADLGTRPVDGFGVRATELGPVAKKITELAGNGMRVGLVVREGRRVDMLLEMLANHGLHPRTASDPHDIPTETVSLLVGDLPRGFIAESSGWAFIPSTALFGGQAGARKRRQSHTFFDVSVRNVAQLKDGDFVVHRIHGLGLYRGLHRLNLQGAEQDFVALEYRGGDRMYLPVTQLAQLSQYSPSRAKPKVQLDRLGGATWQKRTGKVRDSLLNMAAELLAVYAKRELASREAYQEAGDLYRSFVARFPHDETPDQAAAITAVEADLDQDEPMDRLICGDVGFGKTEVAMRAAVRVVESGKQVAILCPTTVLAFQHSRTFKERVGDLPIRVEMLSRFLTPAQTKDVLSRLKSGEIDVVVGTTKMLGRSVKYRDLGLLVIDEEHRFGVRQKERLKAMRADVDVLSMSATPIPRTLEMALSGIRDMSIIATPPAERLAVRTTTSRLTRTRVRDAILHELQRDGQVYFVHNRVQDIDVVADRLREWVPEASFGVAHGQMSNDELERVLVDFIEQRFHVLVCSAIVESGVDLPNVNTMIVNRADLFGLAQLYQLRGRVGRASVRGNCILVTPEEMTRDARKRVRVILEASQLGAGFQVASADLELRGGGNLIGDAQSGNIDAVGYEMWLELLAEAVRDARGRHERAQIEPEVSVPVPSFIPDDYIRDVPDRLGWYKQLSSVSTLPGLDSLLEQLENLNGELPPEAQNLGGLTATRLYCQKLGFTRCSWLKVRVVFELHEHADSRDAIRRLVDDHPRRFELSPDGNTFTARFTPQESNRPFRFLRWLFVQLTKAE